MRHIPDPRVLAIVLALGASAAATADEATTEIPNIVLVIGDDHGWPDFGLMGSEIARTPNLDQLAKEGTLFPYGFTSASECRSALNTLLTGLHPVQWDARIRELQSRGIQRGTYDAILDFVTLPRLLTKAGFTSFQAGKYWEGTYATGGFTQGTKASAGEEMVEKWGWIGAQAGGDSLNLGRTTMKPLRNFLTAHKDERFFVWFAPMLPHTPHDAGPRFLELYAGDSLSESARGYYANVTRFDDRLGELLRLLDARGLREKTLVVYLSDNGWEQGPSDSPDAGLGGPKGKWSMYELGFRTPVIFSWPGRVQAGRVRNDLVAAVDIFSTLVAFAGLDPPKNRHGTSLRPLLLGDAPPSRDSRKRVIGTMRRLRPPPKSAVGGAHTIREENAYFLRDASWRYIWYRDSNKHQNRAEEELYRIDQDPLETRNVLDEFQGVAAGYRNDILLWLDEMERPFQ